MSLEFLRAQDPEIAAAIQGELDRQRGCIELIASENVVSPAVLEAQGSVLTNKYAEGYPGNRFYGGCEKVDIVEQLARERACALFGCNFANVQAHAGVQANAAAYVALGCRPGDTVMGMSLDHGGHLSHGSPANYSGRLYNIVSYGVDLETEYIDYDAMERLAKEHRPKVIVGGASAYPRIIDFARMREIADEVGAKLFIDMAHISGLIAGGVHPSPFPYADIATTTTHKTLRGPRGGLIVTNDEEVAKRVDSAIFPGTQGGPLMHIIAAKAVAFKEAMQPEFKEYTANIVKNCAAMADGIAEGGLRLVSGGTDNHLALVDLTSAGISGREAEQLLEGVGLTANKNCIPNETRSPFVTSGLRVGSAAGTSRGLDADEFHTIGAAIARAVFNADDPAVLAGVRAEVDAIIQRHPLYPMFD